MLFLLALLLLCNNKVINDHGTTIHKQGITNNPRGALSNCSNNTHLCRWQGVDCTTMRPFHVTALSLIGLELAGKITSSLGNMTFLRPLDLEANNFVGPLPILNHLQLHTHYLNNNNFNGIIPDSLTNCFSLANLDLSVN